MKKSLIFLSIIITNLLMISSYAQENKTPLLDYAPDANFFVLKVKNVTELKSKLEKHPLKKNIYNENTQELIEGFYQELKAGPKNDVDAANEELTELSKKSFDAIAKAVNGEVIFLASMDSTKIDALQDKDSVMLAILAHVDQDEFQKFINLEVESAEKSKTKKIIAKKQHEGIDYFSITTEEKGPDFFAAEVNSIGVMNSNEDQFKKIISSIVNKTAFEKGIKSNEKFSGFLNENKNKDAVASFDFTNLFKKMIADTQDPIQKKTFELFKIDQIFQTNAIINFDGKNDNIDLSLHGPDDGFLKFFTFINTDFVPSDFVSAEVSSYSRIFFSIPLLKKLFLELAGAINPEFTAQYPMVLEMIKTNFQFDLEAFIGSMGDDLETFSILHKDGTEEVLALGKLKNSNDFKTGLASIFNNPLVKQNLTPIMSMIESKEGGNQFWVLSPKTKSDSGKEESVALGTVDSYAFLSAPGSATQKHFAEIKKSAEKKLSGSALYNKSKALYPAQLALFTFSKTKNVIELIKNRIKDQVAVLAGINPEVGKVLKLLEGINPEDFTGSISSGLWKDTNKIIFSIKLNHN